MHALHKPTLRDAVTLDASAPLPYTAATIIIDEGFFMTRAISVALIVGGIVLLYFGGQSFHSFSNDVSRAFTGAPTNKTIFLLAGGVIATLAGVIGLASSSRR